MKPGWWRSSHAPPSGAIVMFVLVASLAVAAVLAWQAAAAARQRRAVSEAMLRQYAQLAIWEFSRHSRRDVDEAVSHTLASYAHPARAGHEASSACNCEPLETVERWFEVPPDGVPRTRSGVLPLGLADEIRNQALAEGGSGMEGAPRLRGMSSDPARFIALKVEPHLLPGGGHVGLVATTRSLVPILARTLERASLLPAVLSGTLDARTLVDFRVIDETGTTVVRSLGTTSGPYVVEAALFPDRAMPLVVRASMTAAFIAGLGPEHGGGPRIGIVLALIGVNGLLVAVGVWQLGRERELARLRAGFVAGVSHELRTPLAQIRMFSETLLLDRVRSDAERRRSLAIIEQESRRMSQLVDNVLHLHRPARGAAPPSDVIDLSRLAQDVVESFEGLAGSRRVRLEFLGSDGPAMVRGGAGELRQVLLNLLDNAVKYGPAGQTVRTRVEVRAGEAVLAVEDRGSGIPVEDRERVFEPFERGRDTEGTGGAGIGLAVVRQIVTAHGGRVAAEPGRERGARLIVVLPLCGESPAD